MAAKIRLEINSTDGSETDTFDYWDGDVDRLALNRSLVTFSMLNLL